MNDRKITSYQDIADYILNDLRLAQTGELPAELYEVLGSHSCYQQIAPYFGNQVSGFNMQLTWNAESRALELRFLCWNELVQTFKYYVAKDKQ